jgi:arylsulfatase
MWGALLPGSKIALDPKEETLALLLKKNGYVTGMLGKWHLRNKPSYWPLHYGFDSFMGLPYSHDIWPRDKDGNLITDQKNIRLGWPELTMIEGDKVVDAIRTHAQQEQFTTIFTERAVKFIRDNQHRPWLLYLAQPMPHVPLAVSDKFKGKSGLGLFGDVIMELDWSLGQIMKTLLAGC